MNNKYTFSRRLLDRTLDKLDLANNGYTFSSSMKKYRLVVERLIELGEVIPKLHSNSYGEKEVVWITRRTYNKIRFS